MTTTITDLQARAALLTVSFDGDDYVIGRPDLGSYIAVPEPGAVFITSLQAGLSLAEATDRASDVAGETVDGVDFLEGLTNAGLLDLPVDSDTAAPGGRGRPVRWIEGISPRATAWLFSPAAWTGYGMATAFSIGVLVLRPGAAPARGNTCGSCLIRCCRSWPSSWSPRSPVPSTRCGTGWPVARWGFRPCSGSATAACSSSSKRTSPNSWHCHVDADTVPSWLEWRSISRCWRARWACGSSSSLAPSTCRPS